jgi:hypothetical protein
MTTELTIDPRAPARASGFPSAPPRDTPTNPGYRESDPDAEPRDDQELDDVDSDEAADEDDTTL